MKVKRGEIYLADLSDGTGSEQKKFDRFLSYKIILEINTVQQQSLPVYLPRQLQKQTYQHIITCQRLMVYAIDLWFYVNRYVL